MSFSKELWGGFDIVLSNFSNRRKGLKELLFIITEKSELENEYGKNLKKMYEFDYNIIKEGSLSIAVDSFKDNLNQVYNLYSNSNKTIESSIITKMKDFLITQVNDSKTKVSKVNLAETDFKLLLNDLSVSKVNFHSFAKAVEETKLNIELSKANNNTKADQINKLESKLNSLIKEAKDSENEYIKNLTHVNSYKDFYVKKMEEILDSFQKWRLTIIIS